MEFYTINREERHFGFLFLSLIISNTEFRKRLFEVLNTWLSSDLDPTVFDVYAEVAIFRDYWKSLGDYTDNINDLNSKRREVLEKILVAMDLKQDVIDKYDLFWTGDIGKSKLWFPGKWAHNKINSVQEKEKLWRCRWLCNAKPDIMIQSKNDLVFIEVKVESGMGSNDFGYDQEKTQADIIMVGKNVIDWMSKSRINRINLTNYANQNDLAWSEVLELYKTTYNVNDRGQEMIYRHFSAYFNRRKESETQ